MKRCIAVGTLALTVAALAQAQTDTGPAFGTYKKPFAADSLWNSYPVKPVLGTYQIPLTNKPDWLPTIDAGKFSSGVFEAKETDAPMLIYPYPNSKGVVDTDTEVAVPTYTIPHWPAAALPASGSDGHADIADAKLNRLYSFSNLVKNSEGKWIATRVSWTPLNGSGWGTPSHHYQGGRAAGPAPAGGMIRKDEVNDGKPIYEHALSMSLDFTGLSAAPNHYVYPATAADSTIARANTGQIPEGALLMLPPTFDTSKITDPKLLKVVRTLMKYGAYVVDRNEDTPFAIYVEIGSPWSAMPANQLKLIRESLRRVVSHSGHIAGNGLPRVPETNVNLLSMRGDWIRIQGVGPSGVFDTFTQSLRWTAPTTNFDMIQRNYSNWGLGRVAYAAPKAGQRYKFSVESTGGVKLKMSVEVNKVLQKETKLLGNGESEIIVWPDKANAYYEALKPPGGAASAKAIFVELPPGQ